jgi:hypothetical protein
MLIRSTNLSLRMRGWCVPAARAAALLLIGLPLAFAQPALARSKTNLTGTWSCVCAGGKGTCTFMPRPDAAYCDKGDKDTCSGTCTLYTSTTGITGGAAAGSRAPVGSGGVMKKAP